MFSHDTLPSGPSWDDVQRLLATTEGSSPVAVRDRAILLLLSLYGCRAGELVSLRLEDLNWQREQIQFTRSKSSLKQVYPLTRSVGDAILRYLKEVRPNSSFREVFMSLNAPIRPLGRDALWWVVSRRLRNLGLSLRHYGPHALRHSCATRLLGQGFTMKEIGDHLGHRHPDATSVYAKVDLGGLAPSRGFRDWRSAMKLQLLIEQYVAFRRALGERCITNAGILKAFGRAVGPGIAISEVRADQVNAFLWGSGPVTSAWHVRYAALSGLYRYALTRGYAAESPLPISVPKRPPSLVPYIYTREELRRLLAATEATRHPLRRAEPQTLRAILLVLYGAGLRVGETRKLACEDVDLGSSIATVRDGKFFKSRLVPLAPQLVGVLCNTRRGDRPSTPPAIPKPPSSSVQAGPI